MKIKIIRWIEKQLKEAKAEGIVLGLSGGVDSSVVAALAAQAVGRQRVLALFLPCHSHPGDLADAKLVAKKLGLKTQSVDLSPAYDALTRILPVAGKMARANLRPRLRMSVLYYFANKLNYLVCGTGNKSELMAGYFTKYGDGGVDLLPIGGLLKREVRSLARELKIPQRIINKPPTAGLWPGQTDEGEMGITYVELDDILARLAAKRKQVLSQGKVKRVRKMIAGSEHKRQGAKICFI